MASALHCALLLKQQPPAMPRLASRCAFGSSSTRSIARRERAAGPWLPHGPSLRLPFLLAL